MYMIIYSSLFLEYNKKGLVNSPSKDLLHRLVHLDPLYDSDVMLREWSLDNEKRVYSSHLELGEGGGASSRFSSRRGCSLTSGVEFWQIVTHLATGMVVVLPELSSAQLSHGFGALGSKLSWAAMTLKLHQIASSEPRLSHGRGGSVPN